MADKAFSIEVTVRLYVEADNPRDALWRAREYMDDLDPEFPIGIQAYALNKSSVKEEEKYMDDDGDGEG